MNLNQLKAFYFVVKYRSTTAAAKALYITQPAVTKAIRRLEDHYEIKLLNRFGKKMVPTDAGEMLYHRAEEIFDSERRAEECIRDFQQRRSGHILVSASETFGAYYLSEILLRFNQENPNIQISMEILPNELVVERNVRFLNDLGFTSYPVAHEKIVSKEVLEENLILIAAPTHPLARKRSLKSKDLEGQPFILHEKGSFTRNLVDEKLNSLGIQVKPLMDISSNHCIKKIVQGGSALSFVCEHVARQELTAGTLKALKLSDLTLTRKFYLVYHRDKYFPPTLNELLDIIGQWSQEFMSGRRGKNKG